MPTDPVRHALEEDVAIAPYDPAWPRAFAAEAAHLRACLPAGLIGRIEHFGSTAVPGLAAKPIVDMLVETPALDAVATRIAPILEALGYDYLWRLNEDRSGLAYAWFIKRDAAGRRTHHVHFLEPRSPYWERLLFCDHLIAHPELAAEYATIKRAAAAAHGGDRAAYAHAKGEFIERVTALARGDDGAK
ncbi:MAG: GrpB family protein [Gammaproteobacteria bacterium]|nr:GrpB family protein [Gammaproteobacteria bacterium]MBU1644905.1 GrpB family protein [Gammaproteobacteria bacterium]MBU1971364.1 GrpB family protein [Gammaproteobacteria bacterium]